MNEYQEHKFVCDYLRLQYRDVIFTSDLSGIRLSIGLAKKVKPLKSSRGIPDLIILEPRHGYSGLLIEMKRKGVKLLNKLGKPVNEHIAEQLEVCKRLEAKGYKVQFCFSFEDAKEVIDSYL